MVLIGQSPLKISCNHSPFYLQAGQKYTVKRRVLLMLFSHLKDLKPGLWTTKAASYYTLQCNFPLQGTIPFYQKDRQCHSRKERTARKKEVGIERIADFPLRAGPSLMLVGTLRDIHTSLRRCQYLSPGVGTNCLSPE
jgi:hypothetical protein